MKRVLPGINIQFPISRKIVDGSKTVETRTYSMPNSYVGKELYLIETPGKRGKFKARVVAVVRFGESFQYKSLSAFRQDEKRHRVELNSEWDWTEKPKWGWPVLAVETIEPPVELTVQKGIRFTKAVAVNV